MSAFEIPGWDLNTNVGFFVYSLVLTFPVLSFELYHSFRDPALPWQFAQIGPFNSVYMVGIVLISTTTWTNRHKHILNQNASSNEVMQLEQILIYITFFKIHNHL